MQSWRLFVFGSEKGNGLDRVICLLYWRLCCYACRDPSNIAVHDKTSSNYHRSVIFGKTSPAIETLYEDDPSNPFTMPENASEWLLLENDALTFSRLPRNLVVESLQVVSRTNPLWIYTSRNPMHIACSVRLTKFAILFIVFVIPGTLHDLGPTPASPVVLVMRLLRDILLQKRQVISRTLAARVQPGRSGLGGLGSSGTNDRLFCIEFGQFCSEVAR